MEVIILGISCHLPEKVLTSSGLKDDFPSLDVDKVCQKVGIQERRIVGLGETAADLGYVAANRLLDELEISRQSIDSLIFCTQSPDHFLPASACLLQSRLGLSDASAAFDINQGCSGFIYGLWIAKGLVSAGLCRNVLLVTAETYSRYLSPADWGVRVIFGDGASACLVASTGEGARLGEFVLGTDGRGAENLIVKAGAARHPSAVETRTPREDETGVLRSDEQLFMDGPEVFNFTLRRVPEVIASLAKKTGLATTEIDHFVFHQANHFMNESLRSKLRIPKEKVPVFLERCGNTVSSTIPIVLSEVGSQFVSGSRVMLVGFGVGYSWGACMLDWGPVALMPAECFHEVSQ